MPLSLCLSDNVQAFSAGHRLRILCSDTLNLRAVSGLAVAGIAGDHAIFIQEVQVSTSALDLTHVFSQIALISEADRTATGSAGCEAQRSTSAEPVC